MNWVELVQNATEWLELPESILDSDAFNAVAARLGFSPRALELVMVGDAYIDPLSDTPRVVAWPWYREQDEQIRPASQALATEADIAMPAFLDEPYESAFFLKHTGFGAFERLARRAGIDLAEFEQTRIPVIPMNDFPRIRYEGGGFAEHPAAQRLGTLRSIVYNFDTHPDLYRPALRVMLDAYRAAVEGQPWQLPASVLDLGLPESSEFEPGLVFNTCWSVNGGVLVGTADRVVLVEDHGIRAMSCPGELEFAGGRFAVSVQYGETHVLDLSSGEFIVGDWDPQEALGHALPRSDGDVLAYLLNLSGVISGDGAYQWEPCEGVVQRSADGLVVSGTQDFLEFDEFVADSAPALSIETPQDGMQTSIDGVRFTSREPTTYRVEDSDAAAIAFIDDTFRRLFERGLFVGKDAVARVDFPCHHASFSSDGETLFVLSRDAVVEIDWTTEPRIRRTIDLSLLADALEALDD